MGKTKGRGSEGRSWKKKGRKGKEEEIEKGENSGSKESSRRVGNMGRGGRSGEVRNGSKEVGSREVSQMDKGVWEEAVRKDAYEKTVRSCDKGKRGVYTKKRESVPFVKRRERGGQRIHEGIVEEGLYQAIKVTANGASVFCKEERWQKEDGTRL